jgi:hypothetical protein
MCKLAREIERAIANRAYNPEQEAEQLKRLRIVEAAYERGGDDAAFYADMMFVAGTTD